jgi:hypothetical protein
MSILSPGKDGKKLKSTVRPNGAIAQACAVQFHPYQGCGLRRKTDASAHDGLDLTDISLKDGR